MRRVCQQRIVNIFADGLARAVYIAFCLLFYQRPVIFLRHSERALYVSVLIFLRRTVLLHIGSDNKLLGLPYPIGSLGGRAVIHHSILKNDIKPRVFAFFLAGILDIHHFHGIILHELPLVIALLVLTAQLIISAFLIEVKQQPGKFLLCKRTTESLLPEIINSPVVRHLFSSGQPIWLTGSEIGQHLVERIHENESPFAVIVSFPCYLTLLVVLELSISCERIVIVLRQETHDRQHPVEPLASEQMPLVQASYASCISTFLCLRLGVALCKIAQCRSIHRYYSTSGCLYTLYLFITVFVVLTIHHSPTNAVRSQIQS